MTILILVFTSVAQWPISSAVCSIFVPMITRPSIRTIRSIRRPAHPALIAMSLNRVSLRHRPVHSQPKQSPRVRLDLLSPVFGLAMSSAYFPVMLFSLSMLGLSIIFGLFTSLLLDSILPNLRRHHTNTRHCLSRLQVVWVCHPEASALQWRCEVSSASLCSS